ncbi:allophanate hydrolase [Hydrogenophaga sp.]|uniref:allophanate hydrolase n=1 Tax=Hydrogenophaga sp. TaxID=1904254 RepID=UPI0027266DA0|nr:allophanate hydrolase [Hydrogenophaga sp.]MDO8903872.1 allophanate hydrolase [Hydrogenophaga sp.]
MSLHQLSFDLASVQAAYRDGFTVREVIGEALRRSAADTHHTYIHLLGSDEIEPFVSRLDGADPASLPLYGVPFAIKDNIDLAQIPTTAACPEFAFTPSEHAFVIQQLLAAGAVPVGKTNLDQFATGLNGTRSPYGACQNAHDPAFVSGGSSSGSAVAVARGYVTFALGTDTAGSGRVPASFNQLIGLKPTLGLLSGTGVLPACRSVETVSILALTAGDAQAVLGAVAAFDEADAYSRPAQPMGVDFSAGPFRFGVPRAQDLEFFGNDAASELFAASVQRLSSMGGIAVEFDLTPFLEAARLLYEGPWVAERYVAIQGFIDTQPEAVFGPVRTIIEGGRDKTAAEAFAAAYKLKALRRICDRVWNDVDCLLTPTAGTIYRIDDMEADPIRLNSNLGRYTNFVNLLDLSAVAVPAGRLASGPAQGLPWGVTLVAPAFKDLPLLRLADRFHRLVDGHLGSTTTNVASVPTCTGLPSGELGTAGAGTVRVAVCGAHLSGLPLNHQLTSRGARIVGSPLSAPEYRLYALAGGPVQRPGMVRMAEGGASIALEVWEVPAALFGSFVAGIPAPLGIGKVKLEDGSEATGFICEGLGVEGGTDITHFGGWRAWLAAGAPR